MNTSAQKEWFAVDRSGLRDILARRGIEFAVFELVQNAWDTDAKVVHVQLETVAWGKAKLTVIDDDPDGFKDLTHAFTLFAPSEKKSDATKRGRFNLGEKLVLALCDEATITSTKGTYYFDRRGRRFDNGRQLHGSTFTGLIRMTKEEVSTVTAKMLTLIPPTTCATTFNGVLLASRKPIAVVNCALDTELAGADGRLLRHQRNTTLSIHEPKFGETPSIYELGIPIVETGDRWHYDVGQKVPLSLERDNVTPSYLRSVRVLAFNALPQLITETDANATWGRDASSDSRVSQESLASAIRARFGDKVVAFDPSDPEANKIAVSDGYQVLYGGNLSKSEWQNVRNFALVPPAGQVTPSPKADFSSAESYKPAQPTTQMLRVGQYVKEVGHALMGIRPNVRFVNDAMASFSAAWNEPTLTLTLNVGRLGKKWFDQLDGEAGQLEGIDWLLIHEFGHHYSGDHLSHDYHEALCRLGARMRRMKSPQEIAAVIDLSVERKAAAHDPLDALRL